MRLNKRTFKELLVLGILSLPLFGKWIVPFEEVRLFYDAHVKFFKIYAAALVVGGLLCLVCFVAHEAFKANPDSRYHTFLEWLSRQKQRISIHSTMG